MISKKHLITRNKLQSNW